MGAVKPVKNPSLNRLLQLQRESRYYGEVKGVVVGDDVYFWSDVERLHHADAYVNITGDPDAVALTFRDSFDKQRLTLMPVVEGSTNQSDLALVNGYFKSRGTAVESVRLLLSNRHLRQYVIQGDLYIDNPEWYLSGGEPYIKGREYLKQHPVVASIVERKYLTREQMIRLGADGYLTRAVLCEIPVAKIDGREPVPSASEGNPYIRAKPIRQPIEVQYQRDNDVYILFSGNHRVHQAEINGDAYIPAFVEPDGGRLGLHIKPYRLNNSLGALMTARIKDNRQSAVPTIAERVHSRVLAGEARSRLLTVKRTRNELPRFKIKQGRS